MFGSLALIGFPIKTNPQTSKSMGLLICKDTWHCLRDIKSSTHRGGSLSGFKLEKKKKKMEECLLLPTSKRIGMGVIITDKAAGMRSIDVFSAAGRLKPASCLLEPLKPFVCSGAVSSDSGPSSRVVHQSCVCVYPCVPVWSAVSALPISFPMHHSPLPPS